MPVDHAQQQGGFECPPDGMEATQCMRCGSSASAGYGLMGGGYGPYVICDNLCGWFYKEQEGPEPRPLPDFFYSVICRFVPIYEGGPRHEITAVCDRCGESPGEAVRFWVDQPNINQHATVVSWFVTHRKECKKP